MVIRYGRGGDAEEEPTHISSDQMLRLGVLSNWLGMILGAAGLYRGSFFQNTSYVENCLGAAPSVQSPPWIMVFLSGGKKKKSHLISMITSSPDLQIQKQLLLLFLHTSNQGENFLTVFVAFGHSPWTVPSIRMAGRSYCLCSKRQEFQWLLGGLTWSEIPLFPPG